jgi:hypothetical protein
MSRTERGKLINSAGIEWIAHDLKCARPTLGQGRKGAIDFFGRGSVKNLDLSPKLSGGFVYVSQLNFRFWTLGIAEHCNENAFGHHVMQQTKGLINTSEGWSRDVSEDIAREICQRARETGKQLPFGTKVFAEYQLGEDCKV